MMNRLLILLSLLLSAFSGCSKKQTTIITFISDIEAEVEIYDPVDGMPNSFYITKKLHLQPGIPVEHEMEVDGFAYVRYKSREIIDYRYDMPVLARTRLEMRYKDGKLELSGDNAAGIKYLHDNYTLKGLSYHTDFLESFLKSRYEDMDTINFKELDKDIQDWQAGLQYKKDLRKMLESGDIGKDFYEILSQDLENVSIEVQYDFYESAIRGQIFKNPPTTEEKNKLAERIENLYISNGARNVTFKCLYYPSRYYFLKETLLNDKETENRQDSLFGYSAIYFLAPDSLQLSSFGNDAIFELQAGVGSLTDEKFIRWFQNKFPGKEFTDIVSKLYLEKVEKLKAKNTDPVFLDREIIGSFEELVQQEGLKDKNLYIDMWASWCSPCLAEFRNNEYIHKLLEKYQDVATVYISIDEDENEAAWKNQINFHKLNGYHLRATKSFVDYLSKLLYDGKSVGVPRYLLVGKDGKVLDDNLPRPSQSSELQKRLDVLLTSK